MTRPVPCSTPSSSRSSASSDGAKALKQGGSRGQEVDDREGEPRAEVRRAAGEPLPALRSAPLVLSQVRTVPHLLERDGEPRRAARRSQGQLVGIHRGRGPVGAQATGLSEPPGIPALG